MRSAAKVAGIGVANAGIRSGRTGIPAAAEHPVVQRAGQAIRPATMTATGDAHAAAHLQQKPAWELDDWEFAGFEKAEPPARLVFGPAPTLEEANSATSELKEALENVCLAPNGQTGLVGPFGVTGLSLSSNPDYFETKDCATSNSRAVVLPAPSALQAFKLLNESSAALPFRSLSRHTRPQWIRNRRNRLGMSSFRSQDPLRSRLRYLMMEVSQGNRRLDSYILSRTSRSLSLIWQITPLLIFRAYLASLLRKMPLHLLLAVPTQHM